MSLLAELNSLILFSRDFKRIVLGRYLLMNILSRKFAMYIGVALRNRRVFSNNVQSPIVLSEFLKSKRIFLFHRPRIKIHGVIWISVK